MKRIGNVLLAMLLILPTLSFPEQHKNAEASATYKAEVLEIVDKISNSKLQSNAKYNVKTMTMKQFVAERMDIDGLYDAIFFGEGDYNPALPRLNPDPSTSPNALDTSNSTRRTNEHNTTDKMNDITLLKANEIIRDYINKGLLVVFHTKIKNQACENKKIDGKKCVLKESLYKQYETGYPNVKYIDDWKKFTNLVTENNRPRFTLTSAPQGINAEFEETNNLVFNFKLLKGQKENLTVNLYFDANFDNRYSPEEIIKTAKLTDLKELTTNEFEFTYKLAKGYTGPRYWKFEVVNHVGLKQIETDVFKFSGEKLELSVLQVLPNSGAGNLTNVLSAHNISGKKDNVIDTDEYKITIDTVRLSSFNTSGYHALNSGKYNMVIFGFEDSYASNQIISPQAAQAVRAYAETGQSLFLNHDTFIRKDKPGTNVTLNPTTNWIEYLFDLSGQTYEVESTSGNNVSMETKLKNPGKYFAEHNLGWGALAPTTKATKMNDGIITNYPYNLSSEVTIANTHSQYFALDLEDPNVIPWYNLKSNNRDIYDSWNHYYIYSRNNVTYSGAGHSSSNFGPQEQQLFVNTMYRAFIGANHQPIITVNSPMNGENIPSYQKELTINYKVEDLDLTDRFLDTKVFANDSLIYDRANVPNGSPISVLYEHNLQQGGDVVIKIEATDKKGARKVEEFTVQIEKVEANLEISREIANPNETGIYKVGEPITINYSVAPSAVNLEEQELEGSKFKPFAILESAVNNLQLEEEITLYSKDTFDKNNGILRAIFFDEDNSAPSLQKYVEEGYGSPVSVSYLNQQRDGSQVFHIINGNKTGKLVDGLRTIVTRGEEIYIAVADSLPVGNKPSYVKFACFNNLESNEANGNGNYEVSGQFCGFYGEGFNTERTINFKETFPMEFSIDETAISGLENVEVINNNNGTTTIEGNIVITYRNSSDGYMADPFSFTIIFTPEQKGDYELSNSTLTDAVSEDKYEFIPIFISVKDGLNGINVPDELRLNLGGGEKNIPIAYDPSDAMIDGIIKESRWGVKDETIATVDQNGAVTPHKVGTTIVVVEVTDIFGETLSKEVKIVVFNPLLELRSADNLSLYVDEVKSLNLHLAPRSARADLKWQVGDRDIIELNKDDASVKGLAPGTTSVTISGIGIDGEPLSTTTTIEVIQKVERITVSPSPLILKYGDSYELNHFDVRVYPENASNKDFEWVYKSNSVIEMDDTGVIRATGTGETNITVKSKDGYAVENVPVIVVSLLDSILFNPSTIKVEKGKSINVDSLIKKNPGNTTEKIIEKKFKVSNPHLAEISNSGVLQTKRIGEVKVDVTAKSESGKPLKATLTIEIVEERNSGDSSNSRDKY